MEHQIKRLTPKPPPVAEIQVTFTPEEWGILASAIKNNFPLTWDSSVYSSGSPGELFVDRIRKIDNEVNQ